MFQVLNFELGIMSVGSAGVKISAIKTIAPKGADTGWKVGVNVTWLLIRGLIVIIENDTAIPVEVFVVLRRIGGSGIIRMIVLVMNWWCRRRPGE
jgi:hypothetical protein